MDEELKKYITETKQIVKELNEEYRIKMNQLDSRFRFRMIILGTITILIALGIFGLSLIF